MAEVLEHGLLRTRRVCVCERLRGALAMARASKHEPERA